MSRAEAIPGAIVVRLDRKGERMPGLWRVVDVAPWDAKCHLAQGGRADWYSLSRLRLAAEEEKR